MSEISIIISTHYRVSLFQVSVIVVIMERRTLLRNLRRIGQKV